MHECAEDLPQEMRSHSLTGARRYSFPFDHLHSALPLVCEVNQSVPRLSSATAFELLTNSISISRDIVAQIFADGNSPLSAKTQGYTILALTGY